MRRNFLIKNLFYVTTLGMLLFFYINLRYTHSALSNNMVNIENTMSKIILKLVESKGMSKSHQTELADLKYILLWTSPKNVPFVYMGQGQQGFIDRNCSYINCFVTGNRSYFDDVRKFDVIAFAGPEIVRMGKQVLPGKRSLHQKYAFASIESADYYPVCSNKLDDFFNWTWTYRTDSTARWGYIVVRDANNNVIGPNTDMHWMKLSEMDPVSDEFKEKLKTKSKAVAWFVSNCFSRSNREKFVKEVQEKLKKYDLSVDVYGRCGTLKCPRDKEEECNKMIETDYYFYFSFENSFATDYVTEKLLYPLQHNAVPVVFGAANYTRFMPDGIYLNARELGAEKLADKINELISNPDMYAEYFKWKKYYSYHRRHESVETDDYYRFCSMLNEEDLVKRTSTYPKFREWWDPPHRC